MQQFDSQSSLPVASSDQKTDCEMLKDPHEEDIEDPDIPDSTIVEVQSDFPPESFWLSKDAEFDWFDRNAFLERKESTKGSFNSVNLNPSHSNSSSQRYAVSVKPKAPIIGLPKTQKTTYVDLKCRQCKPVNVRLFPKQSYSVGKAPVTEPSSPKVSCIGRVRSKRCPSRRKSAAQAIEPVKPANQRSCTGRPHKGGLISRILSIFRSEGHRSRGNGKSSSSSEKVKKPAERSGSRRVCVSVTVKPVNSEPETPSEPGDLGGMMRFASGRRSDGWGGLENDDVARFHSLDSEVCETLGLGVGPTR